MLGMVRGATVPARWANSMVMGEEMGTVTVVPAELVKLMALMVTAHSSTESEGVSPMLIRTGVEEAGGGVVVVPVPPLLHPMMPAVTSARERNVEAAKRVLGDCCTGSPSDRSSVSYTLVVWEDLQFIESGVDISIEGRDSVR